MSPVSPWIVSVLDYLPVTVVAVREQTVSAASAASAHSTPLAGYVHGRGDQGSLEYIADHAVVGVSSYNTGACDGTMISGLSPVVDARVCR